MLAIKFTLRHYPFLDLYLDVFISYQTHIANFITCSKSETDMISFICQTQS